MSNSDSSPIRIKRHTSKKLNKNSNEDKKCDCHKEMSDLKSGMLSKLGQIQEQMKIIAESQAELKVFMKEILSNGQKYLGQEHEFPIKTVEDLIKLNDKITPQNRDIFINTIKSLIVPHGIKKNLKYVLADEVVNAYNIEGVHGKKSLKHLENFYDVLNASIYVGNESGSKESQLRESIRLQKKRFLQKLKEKNM